MSYPLQFPQLTGLVGLAAAAIPDSFSGMAEAKWAEREWYEAIGKLAVYFEHAKLSAQVFILYDIQSDRRSDELEAKLSAIVQYFPANTLEEMIKSLLSRSGRLKPDDEAVLRRFKKLNENRNRIIHASWYVSRVPATEITALHFHKPNSPLPHGEKTVTRSELEQLVTEAHEVLMALDALNDRWLKKP